MASQRQIVSHWSSSLENFQTSPLDFYASVERAIASRQVPDIRLSRVDWREGGLLSAKREYLRVERRRLIFDICGAPFGTGFFVSSWLIESTPSPAGAIFLAVVFPISSLFLFFALFGPRMEGLFLWILTLFFSACFVVVGISQGANWADPVLEIPLLGAILRRLFQPLTYYRIDTTLMFQQAIHASILEVVDEITKVKGIRPLSELERKPIMREFFQR